MRVEGISNSNATITTSSNQASAQKTDIGSKGQFHNSDLQQKAQQRAQEADVIHAIEKANKQISSYDRKLEFSIHEGTKEIVVKVIDTKDDTVIREIPSEKILDMVAKMWELAGLIVDEKR